MSFLTGQSNHTWRPAMTADTTDPSYWLNWRFFLCALWILLAIFGAAIIIWRYECCNRSKSHERENRREKVGTLYKDEAWTTFSKKIHPIWLLAYRVIGFSILLTVILTDNIIHGPRVFYFYTEWTFTLVTSYFGLASIFSIHGYLHYRNEVRGVDFVGSDAEQGTYTAPTLGDNANPHAVAISLKSDEESYIRKPAAVWGYTFQIVFQACAGAVVLTDVVFWLIIYPFLTSKEYRLDIMKVSMHSVNACVLLGEVILNNLRFPFFRVAYFVLWTCIFVIFQWIIHACVPIWWPYPFLDLSSPYAPLWYMGVGLLTILCFAIFAAIIRLKEFCWSKIQQDSNLKLNTTRIQIHSLPMA